LLARFAQPGTFLPVFNHLRDCTPWKLKCSLPIRYTTSIMREATLVYAPVEGPPCILGYLKVNPDQTLEWNIRKDVSFASEDDAAVIAGLREHLEDGSAAIGGAAFFQWITSNFSHTIQVQEVGHTASRAGGGPRCPVLNFRNFPVPSASATTDGG
jgi:hypothetical protein